MWRPYLGRSRKEIRDQILSKQVQLKKTDIPTGWSLESADFINKCLQRKPANRLGAQGPHEVKGHIWMRDFNWKSVYEKRMATPIKTVKMDYPFSITDDIDSEMAEKLKSNGLLLRRKSIQDLFKGYEYHYDMEEKAKTRRPNGIPSLIKELDPLSLTAK